MEMNHTDFEIDKGTIAALIKRRNAMKILIFLAKSEDVFYLQEIADNLDMNEMTAHYNLSKLIDARIVRKDDNVIDARTKYYELTDRKLAEKAIEKYKKSVSFHLARFVPYDKTTTEHLKKDNRFLEACQFYGLSVSEGISAVLSCPKIGSETHSGRSIIWRKEQGYDVDILEEARRAIS